MNFIWIPLGFLLVSFLTNGIQAQTDGNSLIDPKINLDPKLRKALLRVLTNLDDEDKQNVDEIKEDLVTEKSESDEKRIVKNVYDVHSFSADRSSETAVENQNTGEEEINFIISKKATPVELEPDTIVAGSSDSESRAAKSNVLSDSDKSNNFVTAKPNSDLNAPLPTAQTDTDGANSETGKVEEVQFFSAPLVAAFTVHQDELGLPHSVIPLYKDDSTINKPRDSNKASASTSNNNVLNQGIIIGNEKPSLFQQQLFELYKERQQQQEALLQQRQRQRELEEQRRLQEQQRLLQNRLKEEELRRQQQLRDQENQRRQQSFRQQSSFSNSPFVSFQPSISTASSQQPFLFQQQLPNREAVDFLATLRQQNVQDLPLQQNHIPSNFNQALHPLQQIDNPSLNNLVFSQSDPGLNSNRVFRQEQQTGNFGLNQNNQNTAFRQQTSLGQNSFQTLRTLQPPIQNSINEFRPQQSTINFRQQPSYTLADRQLKNLLYQSGVYQTADGRQEDLNIVSKILSLNHFGGQFNGVLRRSDDAATYYFKN